MSDEIRDSILGNMKPGEIEPHKNDGAEDVVSVARRRAMKVGITAVPLILTLRGKPLFGQEPPNPSVAASIAAGSSLHS